MLSGRSPTNGALNLPVRRVALVVEDDPMVLDIAVGYLESLGYSVIQASDGETALTLLDKAPHVDLLLTDVVMPGRMPGPRLAQLARERRPDLKVLFMSGYTEDAFVHQGRLDPGVTLLSKPFRRDDLERKIRQVMEAG